VCVQGGLLLCRSIWTELWADVSKRLLGTFEHLHGSESDLAWHSYPLISLNRGAGRHFWKGL
jgi:hypothetical protein